MKELLELKENIENIHVTYDYDGTYTDLLNTTIDYMNATQDYSFEYLFEDFIDYDIAENMLRNELENGGLERVYYFLGDINPNDNLFIINGYGNLHSVEKSDLDFLKEEILDNINAKIKWQNIQGKE